MFWLNTQMKWAEQSSSTFPVYDTRPEKSMSVRAVWGQWTNKCDYCLLIDGWFPHETFCQSYYANTYTPSDTPSKATGVNYKARKCHVLSAPGVPGSSQKSLPLPATDTNGAMTDTSQSTHILCWVAAPDRSSLAEEKSQELAATARISPNMKLMKEQTRSSFTSDHQCCQSSTGAALTMVTLLMFDAQRLTFQVLWQVLPPDGVN